MKLYHGTSLSSAEKLLNRKFPKVGELKKSLGYTLNATNSLEEAKIHSISKKIDDKYGKGAIIEFDINDDSSIYKTDKFIPENKYWYDLHNKNESDIIDISLDDKFDIFLLFNSDVINDVKISKLV